MKFEVKWPTAEDEDDAEAQEVLDRMVGKGELTADVARGVLARRGRFVAVLEELPRRFFGSFSVRPRYTPGSGALVDEATGWRVAQQEAESYAEALAAGKAFQGLGGIVEVLNDHLRYDVLAERFTCRDCEGTGRTGKSGRSTCRRCGGLGKWKVVDGEKWRVD